MCGGIVVQVLTSETDSGLFVEVLDPDYFDRQWRHLHGVVDPDEVKVGDKLWWQSFKGYLSREGEFIDVPVGPCVPTVHPAQCEAEEVDD